MNILIIEDSIVETTLLAKKLQKIMENPPDIVHAETLEKAQGLLANQAMNFDLVFLDLGLPDSRDWHETYEAIAPYTNQLPVIVMTSNKNRGIVAELLKRGVEDFIIKGSQKQNSDTLKEAIEFALLRHKVVDHLSKKAEEKARCVRWLTGGD